MINRQKPSRFYTNQLYGFIIATISQHSSCLALRSSISRMHSTSYKFL